MPTAHTSLVGFDPSIGGPLELSFHRQLRQLALAGGQLALDFGFLAQRGGTLPFSHLLGPFRVVANATLLGQFAKARGDLSFVCKTLSFIREHLPLVCDPFALIGHRLPTLSHAITRLQKGRQALHTLSQFLSAQGKQLAGLRHLLALKRQVFTLVAMPSRSKAIRSRSDATLSRSAAVRMAGSTISALPLLEAVTSALGTFNT
ncbi:hypothetical protein [Mycobacterium sp. pR1184]|uniref:hypothetical protein n=1 Tax=Mycobacterium sp. pR1184 TaxID=3238981 RepID=UPI00351B209A